MAVGLVVLLFESSFVKLLQAERADKVFRMELAKHGCDAAASDGLVATSAQGASFGMVVRFTIWLTFVVIEATPVERLATIPADETFWMPLAVESRNIVLCDRPIATPTLGGEHVKVVLPAEGFPILLVETFLPKLPATLSTEEVLRVPGLVQGGHTFIKNGSITVRTAWRKDIVVICLAVRLPISLKEVLGAQLLITVGACEVLWVPGFSKCCYNLSHDRLVAGCAVSFGGSVDPLLTHVRLQGAKHRLQLVPSIGFGFLWFGVGRITLFRVLHWVGV